MKLRLRAAGTLSVALVLLPAILLAQSTKDGAAGPQSAVGPLACANRLADQSGGSCLEASRDPVFGSLLPYPGAFNVFDPGNFMTVPGGYANQASDSFSTVGGGALNTASERYSTVAGGYGNLVSAIGSTVGGGLLNDSTGPGSTVAGGSGNVASASEASVGGGNSNRASDDRATVGGGAFNTASGRYAVVGGGLSNDAVGYSSVVPGGFDCLAQGDYSFAAGRRARALHQGTFVWSDATNAHFDSTGSDQFLIEADGGVGIGTNAPETALHVDGGTDVAPAGGGFFQAGSSNGLNLALDNNEIMARDNGTTSKLSINVSGGDVILGNGSSSGLVGIGNNNPAAKLDVAANAALDALRVRVAGTTRLVVKSNGAVGVGANFTPSFDLQVSSSAPNGGTAGKPGGGSWSNSSDRRLKKNIEDLEGSLETLLALRGVTYEYKDPEAIGELSGTRIGFVAQEVEEVLPDWVSEKPDGMKMLTIRGFEALAVEAFREQQERIRTLSLENEVLRERVEELELLQGRIDALESLLEGGVGLVAR